MPSDDLEIMLRRVTMRGSVELAAGRNHPRSVKQQALRPAQSDLVDDRRGRGVVLERFQAVGHYLGASERDALPAGAGRMTERGRGRPRAAGIHGGGEDRPRRHREHSVRCHRTLRGRYELQLRRAASWRVVLPAQTDPCRRSWGGVQVDYPVLAPAGSRAQVDPDVAGNGYAAAEGELACVLLLERRARVLMLA